MRLSLVAAMLSASMAPAMALPDAVKTAQQISRDLGLQTDLPGKNGALITPKTQEHHSSDAPATFNLLSSDIVRLVLYAAIAAGILFAVWSIRDRLPVLGRRRLVAKEVATAKVRNAAVTRMVEAQMEADELARQGRIAEAMHALLLRSLIEVRKRLNVSFADSLTSREILKALSLPDIGKASLADIIRRVEFVYFGDYHAGEQDYAACRASYAQLTEAMQTRAGA